MDVDLPCDDEDDFEADPEYNVLAEPEQEAEDDHVLPSKVTSQYTANFSSLLMDLTTFSSGIVMHSNMYRLSMYSRLLFYFVY